MEIRYPDCLSGGRLESAKKLMTRCPAVDRQAVLDEFAAMLRDGIVRHRTVQARALSHACQSRRSAKIAQK